MNDAREEHIHDEKGGRCDEDDRGNERKERGKKRKTLHLVSRGKSPTVASTSTLSKLSP